jgi:hypothetical protein
MIDLDVFFINLLFQKRVQIGATECGNIRVMLSMVHILVVWLKQASLGAAPIM